MNYRVVFVDWDGTLSTSRFWEGWAVKDPKTFKQVQAELFASDSLLIENWMRGKLSSEEVIRQINFSTGLPIGLLLTELEQSCRSMRYLDESIPHLVSQLQRQGVKVVIATNNMDTFSRWTVVSLGLDRLFDGVLNSADLGVLKQETSSDETSPFFSDYLQKQNVNPSDCLMIDDSPGIKIVESFGINFQQIERGVGLVDALKNLM